MYPVGDAADADAAEAGTDMSVCAKGSYIPEAGLFPVTICRYVAYKMKGTSELAQT